MNANISRAGLIDPRMRYEMANYIISDEQLDLIERSDGVEIIREGRKNPGYLLTKQSDGTYTRHYYSDEMLKCDEILIHFYGEHYGIESFVLQKIT